MREIVIDAARRYSQLAFMAVVTACLLAIVFARSTRGTAGPLDLVVYAFAAGFGLEFVGSAWTGRPPRRRRSRQLQS